jgi:hypothetical protein
LGLYRLAMRTHSFHVDFLPLATMPWSYESTKARKKNKKFKELSWLVRPRFFDFLPVSSCPHSHLIYVEKDFRKQLFYSRLKAVFNIFRKQLFYSRLKAVFNIFYFLKYIYDINILI